MAEIVGLFVGPVTEVVKCLGEPIMRQFSYLCCFNSNKQNLRDVAKDLVEKNEEVQGRVSVAQNNNEQILPAVTTWLGEVEKIQGDMNDINNQIRDIQSGCSAAKSRFLLSRRVKKKSEAMEKLLNKCPKSNEPISHSQPPPSMEVPHIPETPAPEFESRKQIENDVMAILKDEKVNVMGICGMGGLGKTTLANKIKDRVKVEHLFGESLMAVVSQQPDKLKIQGELAENLGLELKDITNLSTRAHKLRTRLNKEGKRVLVVLDDVWEDLDLEELGITCKSGYQGCTILLTSRDRGVLVRMDAQPICEMKILSEIEAWSLFQQNVGSTCLDNQTLHSVAQDVVKECRGLPLAIVTVARALKGHDKPTWQDALQQLKSSNPEDLENVLKDVYTPLKLSYDFLSENAKSIFLLCCLFPEDQNIFLEDLTAYAMGLNLIEGSRNLGDVRNKIYLLVGKLKNRCLLLEGSDKHNVRMHDVVRDVAVFIASSKEKQLIRCGDKCAWISTLLEGRTELLKGTIFPNLRLLRIEGTKWKKISDISFKGMINLNVLSMNSIYSLRSSLPPTTSLKDLRTLLFDQINLETIAIVGELVNLEVFICRNCPYIKMLPIEVGRLVRLKLLELSDCKKLNRVAPGIISSLVELEELKMVSSFKEWEAEKSVGKERTNAALSELQSLSSLTCLTIEIKDSRLIAEKFNLSPNVEKYDISIPTRYFDRGTRFERNIEACLGENEITSLGNWFAKCVSRVECISLYGEGSNVVDLQQLPQNMRSLTLAESSTVKKLVNITSSIGTVLPCLEYLNLDKLVNLEEIYHIDGPIQEGSSINAFQCLKEVYLFHLPALKHWWKSSPNQHNACLPQLQELYIIHCKTMEQVFFWIQEQEGNEIGTIIFPKLKILELSNLPSLTSFSKGIQRIAFPQLAEMKINECPQLKSVVSNISSIGNNNQNNSRWTIHEDSSHLFCKQLQELTINDCEKMEHVFLWTEEENNNEIGTIIFPKLKILKLSYLPKLTSFSKGIERIGFPLLTQMKIKECPQLKSLVSNHDEDDDSSHLFSKQVPSVSLSRLERLKIKGCGKIMSLFSSSIAQNLCSLNKMIIDDCGGMIKVFEDDKGKTSHLFPALQELEIFGLPKLESFCYWGLCDLSNLKVLKLHNCKEMIEVIAVDENFSHACSGETSRLFSQLQKLEIIELPKLKEFCNWAQTEFPFLREVSIFGCPEMERLSLGSLTAPNLKTLRISLKDIAIRAGQDLNAELQQHLFKAKEEESFYKWVLRVKKMERMSELWMDFVQRNNLLELKMKDSTQAAEQISFPSDIVRYRITIGFHEFFQNTSFNREMNLNLPRETSLGNWIHQCVSSVEYMRLQGEGANNLDLGQAHNMRRLIMRESSTVKKLVDKTPPSTDDGSTIVVFPHLERLELENLSRLEEIYHIDASFNMLKGSSINAFKNLRKLHLVGLPALKHLWRSNSPYQDNAAILQLQSLYIHNCQMMEQILFWNDENDAVSEDHQITIIFPSLKYLTLSHLPRLKAVCNGIESIEFPLMSSLRITECQQLKSVVSAVASANDNHDNGDDCDKCLHFSSNPEKVVFGGLKTLDIGGHITSKSSISESSIIQWSDKILIQDFGLQVLAVSGFDNIGSLFSSTIVTNLNNLRELSIYKCAEMVKVIEDDDDDDNKCEMRAACLFPRLKKLHISQLPKLEMFCGWKSCALELPSLENVRIKSCSEMKIFSLGSITTPKLRTVWTEGKKVISNTKDLNVMLRHPSSEKEEEKEEEEREETENPKRGGE